MRLPKLPRRAKKIFMSIAAFILYVFTKCIYASLRVRIDPKTCKIIGQKGSSILIVWHNRISMMPYLKTTWRADVPTVGLVSASKDGEMLMKYFSYFGIDTERGSSKKNGARAAINLIKILRSDRAICITPDGPQGPKYKAKDGILLVCSKVDKARMIFLTIDIEKYWQLKSWDCFKVPKFFSKVTFKAIEFENFAQLENRAAEANLPTLEYCNKILGL